MRSTILAILAALLLITVTEVAYRSSGGLASGLAGMSPTEFQWRIERAETDKTIFFVGDSRVGWGFAEQVFNDELGRTQPGEVRALNAGMPAVSVASLVQHILSRAPQKKPGMMVVNFSPAAFYFFIDLPGFASAQLKYQDILDEKIRIYMQERVYTYGRGYAGIYNQFRAGRRPPRRLAVWVSRTVFPEGSVNAVSEYNDGTPLDRAEFQLNNYGTIFKMLQSNQEPFLARKAATMKALEKARDAGWKIVLVRFPVGSRMRELEEQLPPQFRAETVAAELGIQYIDYHGDERVKGLGTLDESHLTPESARAMAVVLAHDLSGVLFK